MKKKISVVLLSIFIIAGYQSTNLTAVNAISNNNSAAAVKGASSISHADGYILGFSGKTINTADIKFAVKYKDRTTGEISGDLCNWRFSDPEIAAFRNGIIKVLKKGRTNATVTWGGASASVLLLSKDFAGEQYVIYEENFNTLKDGEMPAGWKKIQGGSMKKSGVKKGAFEIDACYTGDNPTRILLPEYLGNFGNYTIQVDVNNLKANDDARWNSIMYRIANNNYPYYQMAVRKNTKAANGVEFAEMTKNALWKVLKKSSYSEPSKPGKMYHYTIKVYDSRVQQYINGKLLVDTDLAGSHLKGRVGFQANGSVMRLDNINITLLEKPLAKTEKPEDKYARVAEINTKIAMAPTIVTELRSADSLEGIISKGTAATVFMNINRQLEVTDRETKEIIGNAAELYKKMETRVIPAFRISDAETADALSEFLERQRIEDVFVMSDKPELVKHVRQKCPIVRGMVEFERVSENAASEELMNILQTTNGSLSKIAVIPSEAASRENMQYLQQRLITVWAKDGADAEIPETQMVNLHRLITAGANGIVTIYPEEAKKALETYNHNVTLVRRPFIIGHRGIPDFVPENTIEGAIAAFQSGADMVENDIHPTKPGADGKRHLAVMHDSTIDRTTNGRGKVEDMTLEELGRYYVNKQFPATYPTAKIPTLNQYLDSFTDNKQVLFIELKSIDPAAVDLCSELIREKKAEDNSVTISYYPEQLKRMSMQMPGISQGFLCSGIADENDVYGSLRKALLNIQPLNTTFNTSYTGLDRKFMEAARHRGVTIWPWTLNDRDTIIKYFKLGIYGLTTNSTHILSDWAISLMPSHSTIFMKKGESVSLKAIAETYRGGRKEVVPDAVVISGNDKIAADGSIITSQNTGTAYIELRYTANLSDNVADSYDLYTQPVKVQID